LLAAGGSAINLDGAVEETKSPHRLPTLCKSIARSPAWRRLRCGPQTSISLFRNLRTARPNRESPIAGALAGRYDSPNSPA
jgi:hypothetical protein